MELRGRGARFSLQVLGYQFGSNAGGVHPDWDANWLVVAGEVTLSDGRRSSFRDPCLTTWEARELGAWLAGVSAGPNREAAPARGGNPELVFTEPCLGFDLARADQQEIELRIYLSLEAEPPFVMAGDRGLFENYLQLLTTRDALRRAATQWEAEVAAFPVRGPEPSRSRGPRQ